MLVCQASLFAGVRQRLGVIVIRFGDDGRIVRQATFDRDDEAGPQATLEAWHRERPSAGD